MRDIREKVVSIILGVTKPERPDLSDHSKSLLAGALDSLDFASVLMALEDDFGLSLAEEDIEGLASIDQIVAFLESKKSA